MGEAETRTTADQTVEKQSQIDPAAAQEYWRRNVRLITILMSIWFVVSFGAAILLATPFSQIPFGNINFAFWMAQQGSIIVFVVLIFVYARQMNKLDREFGVED